MSEIHEPSVVPSPKQKLSMPSVSIAMATYNGERYLLEQLDSLATQTVLPAELIVSDDGSTDTTMEILRAFSYNAPFPIKIFENSKRLGYKANFLKAASLCSGDAIAFCDQDDIWVNKKLEICTREFSEIGLLLCIHSGIVIQTDRPTTARHPDFRTRKVHRPLSLNPLESRPGFAMVFSREILNISDNTDRPRDIWSARTSFQMMAHDEWVWYLASIFGTIVTLPDSLTLYRRHSSNISMFGSAPTLISSISRSIQVVDYSSSIELDLHNYRYLSAIIPNLESKYKIPATKAALLFKDRADLKQIRSRIYDPDVNLFYRFKAFSSLLTRCVYFGSRKFIKFGPKSAVKDFVFGLTGVIRNPNSK